MPDQRDPEAIDLIHAAIGGDGEAFEAVVDHYAGRLRWLIRLRLDAALRARVSADDVLQEAMLVASKRIGRLSIESEAAFWTWLCRVVEQRLTDMRRRHLQAAKRDARREQVRRASPDRSRPAGLEHLLSAHAASPSQRLRTAEQREILQSALTALPDSFREVIVLRILEGLSVQETARIMGRSPGAVSVLLTKAVKRLRDRLAVEGSSSSAGLA
jgi:RNA polymerase sigma-70 factor (ECF subfamily)